MTKEESLNEPRRLTRSRSARVLTGVCGGLGRYFGVDPLSFRVAFVVLALAGGGGVVLYLLLSLVVPSDRAPHAAPSDTVREGVDDLGDGARSVLDDLRAPESQRRNTIGLLLIVLGAILLVHELGGFWWLDSGVAWALILIAAGAWLLYRQGRST